MLEDPKSKVIAFPTRSARKTRRGEIFSNHPEIRAFFRFVKEHGLRKEALALIEEKLAIPGRIHSLKEWN